MNTPWILEELPDWPFDIYIKDTTGDVVINQGRASYSTRQSTPEEVMFGSYMGENQDDAIKYNALQMSQLRLVVRAVNSHHALVKACESLCGVFEGQDDVPMYVMKARAALKLARGES